MSPPQNMFPNNKPWMTKDVQLLLKACNTAFQSDDTQNYSDAKGKQKKGIRCAKAAYKQRIRGPLWNLDPHQAWQVICHITRQSNTSSLTSSSTIEAEQLNMSFSCFRGGKNKDEHRSCSSHQQPDTHHPIGRCDPNTTINPWQAAGPDGVPGQGLRHCAAELGNIISNVFNLSLSQYTVTTCLKTSTIVPVPKQTAIISLNDYRPVALTPIIMKCLDRLVLQHIKAALPPTLDPHQYAYRANRSTGNTTVLHTVLCHLEQQRAYAWLQFHVEHHSTLQTVSQDVRPGVQHNTCLWIKDFLTDWPQSVRMGSHLSSPLSLSTGAPQGCVLSPFLFSLYTLYSIPSSWLGSGS